MLQNLHNGYLDSSLILVTSIGDSFYGRKK